MLPLDVLFQVVRFPINVIHEFFWIRKRACCRKLPDASASCFDRLSMSFAILSVRMPSPVSLSANKILDPYFFYIPQFLPCFYRFDPISNGMASVTIGHNF